MIPWTVAPQVPLPKFSRQEYWSRFPFPSTGDLPDPGIKPRSPALQAYSLLPEPRVTALRDRISYNDQFLSGKKKKLICCRELLLNVCAEVSSSGIRCFLKKYLFIKLDWVLAVACRMFFGCGMQTLSCSMWDLVIWLRIKPKPPVLEAWYFSYTTTREVPRYIALSISEISPKYHPMM